MLSLADDWDPNLWSLPEPCRIYGDDRAEISALVSIEDYQWALQWQWSPKWSRGGRKVYLRRNVQELRANLGVCPETGRRLRDRTQRTLFLHIAIMERMGDPQPTPDHVIVDHRNGDGLDCQRHNLRWATVGMNNRNINGKHAYTLGDW